MYRRGFTLMELLVVIAIVGFISAVIVADVNTALAKGRDARRKSDFHQIEAALALYKLKNGTYPSTSATGPTDPSHTQYSTMAGTGWLNALVTDSDLPSAPKDPLNVDHGPWCFSGGSTHNTIYTYASDGTHYVLCSWMENATDSGTLQYTDVPSPWNPANLLHANANYSAYNYVIAK